jgi:hypothetical protein
MMIKKRLLLSSILLCAGLNVARSQLPSPVEPQLEVIATDGAGREKHLPSINGVVPMVMVRPNQTVPITLQFPSDKAGTRVAAMPLDGGSINRNDLVVLPTGRVIFTFKPSAAPGRYRLLVQTPSEQHVLSFYVVDPANPPFKRPRPR